MTASQRFDFIKLDIEGEEKALLWDPASVAALCRARCIFIELHGRFTPGVDAAWDHFVDHGCPSGGGGRFTKVGTYGEYHLACRNSAIWELQREGVDVAAGIHWQKRSQIPEKGNVRPLKATPHTWGA